MTNNNNNNNNNKPNDDNNNDDSRNRSKKAAAWRRLRAPLSSHVQTVLTQARRDLWSSREPPAMFLLIPLRDYCLDPYLALSGILWPRLLTAGSRWDRAVAGSFEIGCVPVIRLLYGSSSSQTAAFNHKAASSRTVARQAVLFDTSPQGNSALLSPRREKPSNFRSAFSGALAFLVSAVADILQAIRNPAKMSKWYACLTQLDGYLAASGVGDQLVEAVTKPLWAGRLWDNLKILNDIQEQDDVDRIVNAALDKNKHSSGVDGSNISAEQEKQQQEEEEQRHHLQMGHRLMRFATAAYGTEMIQSAADAAVDYSQMYESTKAAICSHAQLDSPDDVQLLYTGNNNNNNNDDSNDTTDENTRSDTTTGIDENASNPDQTTTTTESSGSKSGHVLHHFVAVDHNLKAVVLALRGTLSISGALVDLQAMECDFCDGAVQAHSGIAKMAENVWQQSGAAIQQILQQWPDYKFILTGHSLGAGTACLLNLKCHVQPHLIFPNGSGTNNNQRPIECYAFAPPPVACWHPRHSGTTETTTATKEQQQQQQQQVRVQQAIQNCVAYIHDNDVVPHLSVAAVCRLAALLDAVDNCTEHIWFWKRWLIYQEWRPIPENIWTAVRQVVAKQQQEQQEQEKETAENTTATGAPPPSVVMTIPAKVVVWCQQNVLNQRFTAISCDPAAVARGNIFVCPDMVTDHLCEQYEDALDDLVVVSSSSSSSSSSS